MHGVKLQKYDIFECLWCVGSMHQVCKFCWMLPNQVTLLTHCLSFVTSAASGEFILGKGFRNFKGSLLGSFHCVYLHTEPG